MSKNNETLEQKKQRLAALAEEVRIEEEAAEKSNAEAVWELYKANGLTLEILFKYLPKGITKGAIGAAVGMGASAQEKDKSSKPAKDKATDDDGLTAKLRAAMVEGETYWDGDKAHKPYRAIKIGNISTWLKQAFAKDATCVERFRQPKQS